ncbi:plasmid maintenance protein, partial [Borrelia persica]|uniref:plasmid maintenance protein n=1 Tax=Borrelia persica TaxID=44448 RepID=UPI00056E6F7D
KKADFYKKKKRDCKIIRKDVETRLLSDYKISKKYVKQIKELSNNDSTYINALLNLEQAIIDYGIEYGLENILEHFLKQFANRYKHKVWMMMKREDGIINDYEIIWEGRFRDWYPNKYKKRCVEKSVYGESICIGKKLAEKERKKATKNLRNHETEKKAKKEKRRLELLRREAYLQKLFEQEAKERKERLRRAEEKRVHLKDRARESILTNLKKNIGNNAQSNETESLLDKTPPNILSESLSNEDIECKNDCIESPIKLDGMISDTLEQGITDN